MHAPGASSISGGSDYVLFLKLAVSVSPILSLPCLIYEDLSFCSAPLHLFIKTTWGFRAFGLLDWLTGWFDHVWIQVYSSDVNSQHTLLFTHVASAPPIEGATLAECKVEEHFLMVSLHLHHGLSRKHAGSTSHRIEEALILQPPQISLVS